MALTRIAYFRVPWAPDLAENCGDIDGVTLIPVDTQEELEAAAGTSDALVISAQHYSSSLADFVAAVDSPVRWIQFLTAGFDPADRWGVREDVVVTNGSTAWGPVVAEHAVALLLACLRQIPQIERLRLRQAWDRPGLLPRLEALEGSRVGVLGYGAIGTGVARRLVAFDAEVAAFARTSRPVAGIDGVHALERLPEFLSGLDALISALPLTDATRRLVDGDLLDRLKPSCIVVNVGRGPTVDEDALWQRLNDGRLAAAALDVAAVEPMPAGNPLWQLDNVILSPHVAGFGSQAAGRRLANMCRHNIERFRAGQPLLDEVQPVRRISPAVPASVPGSR